MDDNWCVISDIWLSIMLNWNVWQGFCIACGEYCKWRVNTWLGCDFGDNFLHRWGEVLELVPGWRRLRTIFCCYKLCYEPELKYQWNPVLFPLPWPAYNNSLVDLGFKLLVKTVSISLNLLKTLVVNSLYTRFYHQDRHNGDSVHP